MKVYSVFFAYILFFGLFAGECYSVTFNCTPADYQQNLKNMNPGDTLLLSAGNYTGGMNLFSMNGSADKWYVIKSATEHTAVFLGRSGSNTINIENSSYIKIEGLKLDGQNIPDIDGIKAGGASTSFTHNIWLDNNIIVGHGFDQQTCGISTKITSWDWLISRNIVSEAGTGIYLGNSDGSAPFIKGIIEFNVVTNPTGYCMQIKQQNDRPAIAGIPGDGCYTLIRHNVFAKDDRPSPDGDRPNLLVGGQPLTGTGTGDRVEIYGNFLNNNPREFLFQGTGNISIHNNIFVTAYLGAINLQVQNGRNPNEIFVYNNTILASQTGFKYSSVKSLNIRGNYIFANTPLMPPRAINDDQYGMPADAASYLNSPSFILDSMDFYPKKGIGFQFIDMSGFAKDSGKAFDFNGDKQEGKYYGAYSGSGSNPGWQLSYSIKSKSQTPLQNVWAVGPASNYKYPSQVAGLVQDGDTVYIEPGTYTGDVCTWTKSNLVIKTKSGYAVFPANGKSAGQKAIWVIQGNNCYLEGIEFRDCKVPDQNGAGIRMEGTNLTIKNCRFINNEDGILAGDNANSEISILNSYFDHNGYGDGYSHNMYINHIKKFTLEYCYTRDAVEGHTIKSRAAETNILYNQVICSDTGTTSYLLDLPNGGKSYVMGNVFYKGSTAHNQAFISYGKEGFTNGYDNRLIALNNTFVNNRSLAVFANIQANAVKALFVNNFFAGKATFFGGTADTLAAVYVDNKDSAYFKDLKNLDFHLTKSSPARGRGINAGLVVPTDMFQSLTEEPSGICSSIARDDGQGNNPDCGAYEYHGAEDVINFDDIKNSSFVLIPNPSQGKFCIRTSDFNTGDLFIKIYDLLGNEVKSQFLPFDGNMSADIDMTNNSKGFYFLKILKGNEILKTEIIFLQ